MPQAQSDKPTWVAQAGLVLISVERNGMRLAVTVMQKPMGSCWQVVAAEVRDLEHPLDDHSHKVLGRFEELPAAMQAAEDYEESWAEGYVSLSPCDCGEISDSLEPAVKKAAERSPTG
jgi:hypothetical protein